MRHTALVFVTAIMIVVTVLGGFTTSARAGGPVTPASGDGWFALCRACDLSPTNACVSEIRELNGEAIRDSACGTTVPVPRRPTLPLQHRSPPQYRRQPQHRPMLRQHQHPSPRPTHRASRLANVGVIGSGVLPTSAFGGTAVTWNAKVRRLALRHH